MNLAISIGVLVLVVAGFMSGKWRLGQVAMAGALLLLVFRVLTIEETFAYFANETMTMIAGMFIMSGAILKTNLVPRLRAFMLRRAGTGGVLVWIYLLACMILIQFVLPTPLIGMMLPFMAVLDKDSPVQPSQLLIPGTVMAFVMQGMTPMGIGVGFYGMLNGFLETGGADERLQLLDYGRVGILPAFVMLAYFGLVGWRRFPRNEADTSSLQAGALSESTLKRWQQYAVYIVFVVVIGIMLLGDLSPIPIAAMPAIGAVVLLFCEVLDINDVKNYINLDICFMIAGIMAISSAVQKTGAGDLLADKLLGVLGGNPSGWVVLIVFYMAGALLSQFMSNIGTMGIFVPIAVATALKQGLDPRAFCLAITAGCNAAMLTPAASPSSAVAFAAGRYRMKDLFRVNGPAWILYGACVILMANIVYPISG